MKILPIMVVCSLFSSQIALAQDFRGPGARLSEPETASPTTAVVQDYRWELVLADVSGLAAGMALQRGEVLAAGYLAAPVVHVAHGNVGRGLISLGLRTGLPLVTGYIGATIAEQGCEGAECGLGGLWAGALVGVGTAVVVDWLVLGKVTGKVEKTRGLAVAPALTMGRDGAMSLGLSGAW